MSRARSSPSSSWRTVLLLSAGWLCLSCSQALGLEGLTFEDSELEEDAGAEGDADVQGDAEPSDADVSDGSPTVSFDADSYPALVERRLLVDHPDPAQASYLVYDPETGEVVRHDVLGESHFEAKEPWSWEPGWSLLLQIPRDDGSVLIGYDAESGLAEHVVLDDEGAKAGSSERVAGSPGWTHFLPIEVDGIWHNVAYDSESGRYRFGPALVDEVTKAEVVTGVWQPGWTALAVIPIGNEAGVLKYDARTGNAEVEQLTGDAEGRSSTRAGNLQQDLAMLLTYPSNESLLLLAYSGDLGDVATGWLTLDDALEFDFYESNAWRIELSQMLPLWLGSQPYALTYSVGTGVAELRSVVPLESSPAVVK